MRYGKILRRSLALTVLILAGCSEPPELAAAKKIATKVAQARELMKDRTKGAYDQAEGLLRDALATKGANSIGKQRAHELLGTLLSETTARELSELGDVVENFAEADVGLGRSLSELSGKAGALAYAVGLKDSDDEKLQKYREELLEQIPAAQQARDEAVRLRTAQEQKLAAAKKAALAAATEADGMLLEAAKASGEEQVSKMKEGAAKRLEADRLGIAASGEELVLLRAKEDEIRRASALAGLQEGLERVEELINAHTVMVSRTNLDEESAQAAAEKSAGELLKQVEAFNDSGGKLSAAYEQLIARQNEAVSHFEQALRGAADRGKIFRDFKAAQPAEAEVDERVEMLVELDVEVGLAVSVARAQISLAGLREQKLGVLERVQRRVEQIKRLRKDLAVFGNGKPSVEIDSEEAGSTGTERAESGFFGRLLSRSKKSQAAEKPLTAVGIVMGSPRIDTTAINKSIQETRQAALEDLNSAVRTLWKTALPKLKAESPPDAVVKRLERAEWNWQVWGMLGLVHEARSRIQGRMGRAEQAQADAQAAAIYLAQSKKARAGVLR
ncbi:MAG: hypothetical protein KAT11_00130 [Phycisphaerae bacterium]|nr:hypothetical protein [Phycisphaerae bacterium]